MGYDLRPRNKAVDDLTIGAFCWPWLLESGVGLPIGHGPAFHPGAFVYRARPDGMSICCNDGARITATEAKQMATVARWVADYQDDLYAAWQKLPELERERMEKNTDRLYKLPARRSFVDTLRAFADFAEKSGGFRVF